MEIALSMESADKDSRDLQRPGNQYNRVHHVSRQKSHTPGTAVARPRDMVHSSCYRCGVTTLAWSADSEMWSVTIVATTTMELDTGASRSIINTKNFGNRIHPPSNVPPSISRPVGAQQPASPVYPVGDQG